VHGLKNKGGEFDSTRNQKVPFVTEPGAKRTGGMGSTVGGELVGSGSPGTPSSLSIGEANRCWLARLAWVRKLRAAATRSVGGGGGKLESSTSQDRPSGSRKTGKPGNGSVGSGAAGFERR
jgi:hypothetical protein